MKKTIKKKKIKIIPIIIFIIVISLIVFFIKILIQIPVKNIYIHGNINLNDQEIIELAGIENYPSFVLTLSSTMKSKILKSDYIKNVKIKKRFFGVVDIYIEENNVLFYKVSDFKYVLENGKEIDTNPYNEPCLQVVNYIPDTIYTKFIECLLELDKEVLSKISEIKYDPSEYDDKRFLLYMVDGNYVYLTITKFEHLKYYNEVYATLNGKKGVLYLDSGNHFQILKN